MKKRNMIIKKNYSLCKKPFVDRLCKLDQRSFTPGYAKTWKNVSGVTNNRFSDIEKIWSINYPKELENA